MVHINTGNRYEICDEMGYRITAGPVPVPAKGGVPERFEILSLESGMVSIKEEWDFGKTKTRRLYRENIECLLRDNDIRPLSTQSAADSDTESVEEDSSQDSATTNTVDRATDAIDSAEGSQTTESRSDGSQESSSEPRDASTDTPRPVDDENDDVEFLESDSGTAGEDTDTRQVDDSDTDADESEFLIGS